MSLIDLVFDNAARIGAVVTCCGSLAGGWIYLDGPIPATRHYVMNETQSLKSRVIDNQLQTNTVQRNLLRKEKFDRDLELQKTQEPSIRSILKQTTCRSDRRRARPDRARARAAAEGKVTLLPKSPEQ